MYSKIQSVRYTKTKIFIWGDRFFEKKLGMALKQEIIAWKKISQNLGWAPHFLKDRKKVQTEWLPVLKPSKIISRIKKIYFIYSKRLGNKNSWRFVSAYIFHSKNRHIICIALLWQSSHNSVI